MPGKRQRTRAKVCSTYASKKKPHGVSGGAGFLFFSKEVTANSITGDSVIIIIGFGSTYFYCYFSSGVLILLLAVFVIKRSYASLGQGIKSKSCAK